MSGNDDRQRHEDVARLEGVAEKGASLAALGGGVDRVVVGVTCGAGWL